jgi:transposase-like protein
LLPGRRRRRYTEEFKARVAEECRRPGVSIAAVALANGLNANLLRKWVAEREAAGSLPVVPSEEFVALPVVATSKSADLDSPLRRRVRVLARVSLRCQTRWIGPSLLLSLARHRNRGRAPFGCLAAVRAHSELRTRLGLPLK